MSDIAFVIDESNGAIRRPDLVPIRVRNVSVSRDLEISQFGDFRRVREGEPDPVGGEEGRRPKEIEHELRPPQLHRPAAAIALEGAPAGHRDQDIEHGPDRGEHPVRRVEGWLGEAGIPFARSGQEADGNATANNEKQEQGQRTKAFHRSGHPFAPAACPSRAAILLNCPSAASKSSAISAAMISGAGRASVSVRLLSLIQNKSRLGLSRFNSPSYSRGARFQVDERSIRH